ncbi:hypothetical protein N658DRAFT_295196 [Parathielavia hyrcaniae]|uniref:Uncharacterized protein n=1 Tax=Parathielavia hyrcaniae TaxID=113614 RepID=A0AAN6PWD1_9PEZI|nr:hypothetical protein N658DRAFT_295196 [Parathielavia hyrcaniae]
MPLIASSDQALPIVWHTRINTATGRSPWDSPILAPSLKDYEYSRAVFQSRFDNSRRVFAMTNGCLSLNAEVWKMDSDRPADYEALFLIKLNCCGAWSPLKSTRSPVVLFLRPGDHDAHHDDTARVPPFFRKVEPSPQTWRDAIKAGQWRNLGRHDILIANDPSTDPGNSGPVEWPRGPNVFCPATLITRRSSLNTWKPGNRTGHCGQGSSVGTSRC